jgi:hypothetical protein
MVQQAAFAHLSQAYAEEVDKDPGRLEVRR